VVVEGNGIGAEKASLCIGSPAPSRKELSVACKSETESGIPAGQVSAAAEVDGAASNHPELRPLRHFLDAIPAAAYICDVDGRLILYNEAAVTLWGRMPTVGDDQWCGSYKMHWPDGTAMPLNQCPMAIALKTSRSHWGADAVIERPDGTRRDVLANPQLLHDSTGSVIGALNILVDITERKQKEEASGRLAAIVESSDDAIVGKTLEGIITSWNRSAERIFGYTTREAVGQHISLIIPAARRAEEDYVLAQVRRGARIEHFETERQCKDGRIVKISLTVSPIKNAAGQIIGASKIARDITEQKRAEDALRESEERFKAIFNQVVSGISQTDLDGRFVLVNDRFCQIVGRTKEELMTLRMQDITHPADLPENIELFQRLVRDGVAFEIEKRYVRPDGSDVWVHNSASVVTDRGGRPQYAIADVVDISARKQAEELIRRSNIKLKQANDNLQQFAYSMTHDLQEPLRMMACYSDLLLKKFKDKLDGEADTFVQFIREGAYRMQMLIQDLLQYTQLELGEGVANKPVDCDAALKVALTNLTSAIQQSGAVVTSEPLPTVLGQDIHFVQLFQNLVGNAIKYRREEPPTVHVAAEQRDGVWRFSIRDNGVGIEPQYATSIFGLFQRLEKDTRGTGIGLAICAKVVERHGGQIWVESEVGRGSTFFFTIPVAE
jgi:PAS domain S-box-containing protein